MKQLILLLSIFTFSSVLADDLTVLVKNTQPGIATGSIDLTVSGGTAPYIFSWKGPNGTSFNTEDISNLGEGSYTITVTDKYCGIATLTVQVNSSSTGISTNDGAASISVWPNPVQDVVTIHASEPFQKADLRILTIHGEIVQHLENINGNEINLTVSNLCSGIYFVEMVQNRSLSRTKLLKN